jgi:hypothetical protein
MEFVVSEIDIPRSSMAFVKAAAKLSDNNIGLFGRYPDGVERPLG